MGLIPSFLADPADPKKVSWGSAFALVVVVIAVMALVHRSPLRRLVG